MNDLDREIIELGQYTREHPIRSKFEVAGAVLWNLYDDACQAVKRKAADCSDLVQCVYTIFR